VSSHEHAIECIEMRADEKTAAMNGGRQE